MVKSERSTWVGSGVGRQMMTTSRGNRAQVRSGVPLGDQSMEIDQWEIVLAAALLQI